MGRLQEAVTAVRGRSPLDPKAAVVVEPGLSALADAIEVDAAIPLRELAAFSERSAGRLLSGRLAGVPVAAVLESATSRESAPLRERTLPLRVIRLLGADFLLCFGAASALTASWEPGDLVLLDDHINLLGDNPLVGPNLDGMGPRFPDMSEPYDLELRQLAVEEARRGRIPLGRGVYVAVPGPTPGTRAESRMLRGLGADVAGTGMIPEVIVGRHMDMKVLAVAVVTDVRRAGVLEPADPRERRHALHEAGPALARLVEAVLKRFPARSKPGSTPVPGVR